LQPTAEELQKTFCQEQGADYVPAPDQSKLGFALSTKGQLPINGLRHPVAGDANGWYIWCGERFSDAPDFFSPLHARHLYEDQPELVRLLGLPPGYRFLIAEDHLDVWRDPSLLTV
jgi:hypothetical protein